MRHKGIRYPRPLVTGDTIGVTSPSSGVADRHEARLDLAVQSLRDRGFDVIIGDCMGAETHVSASKQSRAAELMGMLTEPDIAAVVPPWGGEMATDLLPLLDFALLSRCAPKWVVGFSDLTTVMLPLLLRAGWATLHGENLMDTPYRTVEGLLPWTSVAAQRAGAAFTQTSPGRYRTAGFDDIEANPRVDEYVLDAAGAWTVLNGGAEGGVDVTGRLVGGCLDVVSPLAGGPFGDLPAFGREHAEEGLLVFLEAVDWDAFSVGRALYGLRHAGWFAHARGILVGRTRAPDARHYTQHDAVVDALGDLGLPVVLDVECGHVPPRMPIVCGAMGRIVVDGDRHELTQTLT